MYFVDKPCCNGISLPNIAGKKMKKKLLLIVGVVIIASGIFLYSVLFPSFFRPEKETQVFVPLTASKVSGDDDPKTIITARGDWGYPPFEYLNESGKPDGFNIDILKRVSEIMDINIRISLGPWEEVRKEMEEGKIDLVTGMYKTKSRDQQIDFSIPHFMTSIGVFITKDSEIRSIDDLEDKRILVQSGDVGHDYLVENNIGREIVTVKEWDSLLPALLNDEADCAVMGMVQGMKILREKGYKKIHVLSQPLLQRPYCIAVQEGNAQLLALLNEGLNLLKISGEYDQIYEKWFGIYEQSPPFTYKIVKIMAGGILALASIIIFSMLWNYTLRKQVRKQTADLRTALEQLKQANSIKDRFLASVSHELRTPLHGIIGMGQLMEKTDLTSRQSELLGMIQTASNQLFRVLSDLIDISRMDSGKLSLEESRFSLESLMNWLEPILREKAEEKGLAFSMSINENSDTLLVSDKERLAQIIMNLTDNAIKNTDSGKVTVMTTYQPEVPGEKGTVDICVVDTGRGISEKDREDIFTPFSQGAPDSGGLSSGLGLGLSIVKSITELLGGSVEVRSTVGKGSSFIAHLPVRKAAAKDGPPLPVESFSIPVEPMKVLIAEDEGINRLYLKQLLEKEGWKTTAAGNGEEVLKKAEHDSFDLILMDLSMPKVGGLEASRRLRSLESGTGTGRTPIIALTAHAFEENKNECLKAGMDGFISKPFREKSLWEEIRRVLNV
jgi:signal transduction histidine kinase/ABC-type amino acid transport substrate-binding protein